MPTERKAAQDPWSRVFAGGTVDVMSTAMTLVNAPFHDQFHACAFVTGPDEERAVIDPFIAEVARRGEKAVYIVDPRHQCAHETRLRACAPSPDNLEVTNWDEAHLKGGSFDKGRMMTALDEWIQEHATTGRPPLRFVGQMDWIFSSPPGIEQLVSYEASVNDLLVRGKTPAICVYDVRRLSGSLLMDLMRAHPLTVVNGVLHENPFYTPAEELLRELEGRRTTN
jgi:MEDS: MEthanogen/methylotroph, DcmR Sensory domain